MNGEHPKSEAVTSNPKNYDLVTRLRSETFGGGALELDAADEIERLTSELSKRSDRDQLYQERQQFLSRLQAAAGGYQQLGDSLLKTSAERDRLTVERDQLLAAIGEHVTVRSDQYAEIQRLTRERDTAREALRISEQRVREHWPQRDRLRAALNDAQKQLGALALLILQSDHDETLEWARGVKVTFPNGEPTVSVESPSETSGALSEARKLANDVGGAFTYFEPAVRAAIGNTNYTVIMDRVRKIVDEGCTCKPVETNIPSMKHFRMTDLSCPVHGFPEKASVCMGCNSTPCVCAELGGAQEACAKPTPDGPCRSAMGHDGECDGVPY